MKRSNKYITDKIRPYILKALEEKGLDLFELTLRSERGGVVLRITIDKPEGPGIEDCTIASRAVSEFLDSDESNIPFDRYNLEVSTPGLERPLRSESDFKRFIGKKCKITTREKDKTGRKSYTGIIESAEEGKVTLNVVKESAVFELELDNIAKANLVVEFD